MAVLLFLSWSLVLIQGREREDGSRSGLNATIDHSDIRGSEPHGHDPSGAASD